jgi:lipopolysaccharide export system permease protein
MFDLSNFQLTRTDENLFKKNYEMQNLNQLSNSIDSIRDILKVDRENFNKGYMVNLPFYSAMDTVQKPSLKVRTLRGDLLSFFPVNKRGTILQMAVNSAIAARQNLEINHDNLFSRSKLIYKHQIVYHKKFTFSLACFLLFFIGAPLGAIIRKGGLGMPAVISTLFFILFWIISFMGEKYSAQGVLPPWQGMWIASSILLPIGIFLTIKATNDASLLDIDAWTRFFNKLMRTPEQRL